MTHPVDRMEAWDRQMRREWRIGWVVVAIAGAVVALAWSVWA